MTRWQTKLPASAPDIYAPDGAEIRLLTETERASSVLASLQPGQVTAAIHHRTVEETWHVTAGRGELWRRDGEREEIVDLLPGVTVTIPLGTHFQFRAAADSGLSFFIVTVPPWPGADEAVFVEGRWPASKG